MVTDHFLLHVHTHMQAHTCMPHAMLPTKTAFCSNNFYLKYRYLFGCKLFCLEVKMLLHSLKRWFRSFIVWDSVESL